MVHDFSNDPSCTAHDCLCSSCFFRHVVWSGRCCVNGPETCRVLYIRLLSTIPMPNLCVNDILTVRSSCGSSVLTSCLFMFSVSFLFEAYFSGAPSSGASYAPYSPTYAKTKQLVSAGQAWHRNLDRYRSYRPGDFRTPDAASTSSFLLFTTPTLYRLT